MEYSSYITIDQSGGIEKSYTVWRHGGRYQYKVHNWLWYNTISMDDILTKYITGFGTIKFQCFFVIKKYGSVLKMLLRILIPSGKGE